MEPLQEFKAELAQGLKVQSIRLDAFEAQPGQPGEVRPWTGHYCCTMVRTTSIRHGQHSLRAAELTNLHYEKGSVDSSNV